MHMTPERALSRLGEMFMFASLDPAALRHLFERSELRHLQRGAPLFAPGDPCAGLHIVLDGMVKVFATAADGHEKVVDVVGPGQTLPGTHTTRRQPHAFHARVLVDAAVLILPRELLKAEVETDGHVAARLLEDATTQVQRMMRAIEAVSLRSAMQRICDYLLTLPTTRAHHLAAMADTLTDAPPDDHPDTTEPREVTLPISKGTLASLLSITPEHLSRLFKELQVAGLIDMRQRHIRIPDVQRLAHCT